MKFKLTEEQIERGIVSNRASAAVEGIDVDPRFENLSRRQLRGEVTGNQIRREILRSFGLNPDLVK